MKRRSGTVLQYFPSIMGPTWLKNEIAEKFKKT